MDALTADRIQFAFTLVFHYLFPQLTMGLALLILILKTIALRTANEECLGANSALNLPWRNRFRAQGMGPSTPSVGGGLLSMSVSRSVLRSTINCLMAACSAGSSLSSLVRCSSEG